MDREETLGVVREALTALGMEVLAASDDERVSAEERASERLIAAESLLTERNGRAFVHASECRGGPRAGFVFSGNKDALVWTVQKPMNSWPNNAVVIDDEGGRKQIEVWMCIASMCSTCTDQSIIDAKAARYLEGGDLWKKKQAQRGELSGDGKF